MKNKNILTENAQEVNAYSAFNALLNAFETAYIAHGASGCYSELDALAQAVASSVLKKVYDPQARAAEKRNTVTTGGCNPYIATLRRELYADAALLRNLTDSGNDAFGNAFNKDGELVPVVLDEAAEARFNSLLPRGLGDGLEVKHEVVCKLLEVSEKYSGGGLGYLTAPVINRRINRRVLIKADDTAAWVDEETTPLVMVYAHARQFIDGTRAVRTDPRNGYLYLEELTADPESDALETVYRRQKRFADLGGFDNHGNYTVGSESLRDYDSIIGALNLTTRQAQIIDLRMRGYGTQAIATYFGVNEAGIFIHLQRVREKAVKFGIANNDGKLI